MLHRLARSRHATATATATAVLSAALRRCSTGAGEGRGAADTTNPFQSAVARTLRDKVFSPDFAAVKTATPKEAELLQRWRDGDGTADSSDVEPQVADGVRNVAASHGATFRDTRPIDPNESVESKRRRLIFQSRYRGMVEMDLIFGHFARCKLETLDASMLDEYDTLLKQLDSELFRWLVMGVEAPEEVGGLRCFAELRRFITQERAELLGPN
ncbi:Flavinator of succinate dehydrogenase [Novymonas esmeraldas]|uniref:Flavinator of succinate dehydrogenase n=1 Tax=Novymonas esmeraldas TaxID=1808958 RepID=A0AAW0EMU5_9TRYP